MSTFIFDTDKKKAKKHLDMVNGIKGRLVNKALLLASLSQPNAVHAVISALKFGKTQTIKEYAEGEQFIMEQSKKDISKKLAHVKPTCTLKTFS